jgi:hypothetical protein
VPALCIPKTSICIAGLNDFIRRRAGSPKKRRIIAHYHKINKC